MKKRPALWSALPAACLALTLTACGGSDDAGGGEQTTLKVLAASSLTESFTELEKTFEDEHPDVDVQLSFDSSAVLVEQLTQGNDADVLATADEKTMGDAQDADLLTGDPQPFATNTLVIVTPPDDPAGVTSLADLTKADFVTCVPAAPCGNATEKLFTAEGITAKPVSQEQNVKGVLTKVTSGEADAGLVYASDALAAGDAVKTIQAEGADDVVNVDPIATTSDADAAQDWVDLVLGDDGQAVLKKYGFGPAPE